MKNALVFGAVLFLVGCAGDTGGGVKSGDKSGGDKGGGDKGAGAKSTEALLHLRAIEVKAKSLRNETGKLPQGSTGLTPAKDCCSSGGKCKPDPAAWSNPLWVELDFKIEEEHAFQYSYESSEGGGFVAKAVGCGGAKTETLTGVVIEGNLKAEYSSN